MIKTNMIEGSKKSLEVIATFLNYLMNPQNLFINLWNWIVNNSFDICLLIAMFALIGKSFKIKNTGKIIPMSIGIYILIQSIGKVSLK